MLKVQYEFHPYADVFPLMGKDDLASLAKDIRERGQEEAVVLYEGKILDGRNRYLACEAVNVDCHTTVYEGDDPLGYVVSLNLKRRHLSESQRAMVAEKVANLKNGQKKQAVSIDTAEPKSLDDAADLLNVSRPSVARARRVRQSGSPALVKAVESGELSVSAASEIATLKPEQQDKVLESGPREAAKTAATMRKAKEEAGRAFDPDKAAREAASTRWSAATKTMQQAISCVPIDAFHELNTKDKGYFIGRMERFAEQLTEFLVRMHQEGQS